MCVFVRMWLRGCVGLCAMWRTESTLDSFLLVHQLVHFLQALSVYIMQMDVLSEYICLCITFMPCAYGDQKMVLDALKLE